MVNKSLGYEDLMKLPIEILYQSLYRDYKALLIEKGKDDSYIQELEDTIKELKSKLIYKQTTPEVEQKIFEYKRKSIHKNMVETINSLTKSRDFYKEKCDKLENNG